MQWEVLVVAAVLQAQLPLTGKAGGDGKALWETLCAGAVGLASWRLLRAPSFQSQRAAEQGGAQLCVAVGGFPGRRRPLRGSGFIAPAQGTALSGDQRGEDEEEGSRGAPRQQLGGSEDASRPGSVPRRCSGFCVFSLLAASPGPRPSLDDRHHFTRGQAGSRPCTWPAWDPSMGQSGVNGGRCGLPGAQVEAQLCAAPGQRRPGTHPCQPGLTRLRPKSQALRT